MEIDPLKSNDTGLPLLIDIITDELLLLSKNIYHNFINWYLLKATYYCIVDAISIDQLINVLFECYWIQSILFLAVGLETFRRDLAEILVCHQSVDMKGL